MCEEVNVVKNKKLIRKFLELVGATGLYKINRSELIRVEPKPRVPSKEEQEEEILSTRPRRKYVYNPRIKDFDVLVIKVEKREGPPPPSMMTKKKERVSKALKLAAKVPTAQAPSVKNFSVKKCIGPVHQPRRHN